VFTVGSERNLKDNLHFTFLSTSTGIRINMLLIIWFCLCRHERNRRSCVVM